jgi:hypothetical protein
MKYITILNLNKWAWHARGHRFDSDILHLDQDPLKMILRGFFDVKNLIFLIYQHESGREIEVIIRTNSI